MYPGMGGGPPGAAGMTTNQNVLNFFKAVDQDNSGAITSRELQAALVNSQGNNFAESVCVLMVNLFGRAQRGTLNFMEFQSLYEYVNRMFTTFRQVDKDNSGFVEENELTQALSQQGYRFSTDFLKNNLFKGNNRISVDIFMEFSIKLEYLTEQFKQKDTQRNGTMTISYEDFLNICMGCV